MGATGVSDMKLPFFIHLARATFPELYSVSDCTLRVTAKTLDDSGQVCPIAYQMLPFFIHLARATFPELYSVYDCTLRVTARH